jgi:hypothetical protein
VVAPFYPGKKIENWWLVVVQKGGKNDQVSLAELFVELGSF